MKKILFAIIFAAIIPSVVVVHANYQNLVSANDQNFQNSYTIQDGFTTILGDNIPRYRSTTPTETFAINLDKFLNSNSLAGWVQQSNPGLAGIINENLNTSVNSGFQSGNYFRDVVQPTWNQISTIFGNDTNMKKEYAQRGAELVEGYASDMTSGRAPLTITDTQTGQVKSAYAEDMKWLLESAREYQEIGSINMRKHYFDPMKYLDRGAPGMGDIKVAMEFGGVSQLHLQNIVALVNRVKSKFNHSSQVQEDLQYFLDSWPSSDELAVMQSQSVMDVSPTGSDKMKTVNGSLVVSEYGEINNAPNANYYGSQPGQDVRTYKLMDHHENNRSYGYVDGAYNTVSIQIGSRKYQLYDHLYTSPLVFDMDGDGNLEASKGEWLPHDYNNSKVVEFDMDGDDFLDVVEWVGQNDGLLMVTPKMGDVNANHLFGEAGGFTDGFEKLSSLDANKDSKISGKELDTLSIWQDKNGNAKTDAGEVASVTSLGITEISLNHNQLVSSFTQNGVTKKVWDWYPVMFRVKKTS